MPATITKEITIKYAIDSVAELTKAEIIGLLIQDSLNICKTLCQGNQVFEEELDVDLFTVDILEEDWTIKAHLDDERGHWLELNIGEATAGSALDGYYTIRICPLGPEGLYIKYWTWHPTLGLRQYISNWSIEACIEFLTNEEV